MEGLAALYRTMMESDKFKNFAKKKLVPFILVFLFIGVVTLISLTKTRTTMGKTRVCK